MGLCLQSSPSSEGLGGGGRMGHGLVGRGGFGLCLISLSLNGCWAYAVREQEEEMHGAVHGGSLASAWTSSKDPVVLGSRAVLHVVTRGHIHIMKAHDILAPPHKSLNISVCSFLFYKQRW